MNRVKPQVRGLQPRFLIVPGLQAGSSAACLQAATRGDVLMVLQGRLGPPSHAASR